MAPRLPLWEVEKLDQELTNELQWSRASLCGSMQQITGRKQSETKNGTGEIKTGISISVEARSWKRPLHLDV